VDLMDVRKESSGNSQAAAEQDINDRDEDEKDYAVTKSIFKRIIDDVTLKSDDVLMGRINVNTATKTVLKTLPGMDDDLASAIIRYREGNAQGFSSIADLMDLSSMTKEKFSKMEDFITVRSNVFQIKSYGSSSSGLATATIECIIDRSEDVPQILYWLESSP